MHFLYRQKQETSTCAARVAYFVKATPISPNAKNSVQQLGLPTDPQRFAIVDAYTVDDVQNATKGLTLHDPAVKAVANALVKARLLARPSEVLNLFERVRQNSTVLAMRQRAQLHLMLPDSEAGILKRLAIPLSSNCNTMFRGTGNWAVAPLCRIDPRLHTLKPSTVPTGRMLKACENIRDTMMYFVHTHSKSCSKGLYRDVVGR